MCIRDRLQQCGEAHRKDGERGQGRDARPCRPPRGADRPRGPPAVTSARLNGRELTSSERIQTETASFRRKYPEELHMSFATRFARALIPAIVVMAPVAADAKPSADMQLVKAHLQSVDSMTANFVQTDSKGRSLSGTLQLKRPGRIRFEYGKGVNVLLVADGRKLTFIDYDVGQKSSWDLNKTP